MGDEVDTGDIEPDHHGGLPGDLGIVRMNVIGAIDRRAAGAHVSGLLELHERALVRNIVEFASRPFERFVRLTVDRNPGQDFLVADAATWISVREFDQLLDRVN
ncbi:MAG: hypothetical protein KDI45_17560, partial [Candidatus Accumulibacter sp.]|nr:hypothetical protein [Accumulibacter sp.]